MEHLPELITALAGVMTAVGAGLAFIWREFKAVNTANDARLTEIEAQLEECRLREQASHLRRVKHLTVIELLWQEVLRLSPKGNKVLGRAKHLLDELKDTDADS